MFTPGHTALGGEHAYDDNPGQRGCEVTLRDFKARLLGRIDLAKHLPGLHPSDGEEYSKLDCPACKAPGRAYRYHGSDVITCNRSNECGAQSSVVALLAGVGASAPSATAYVEVLRGAAVAVGMNAGDLDEASATAFREAAHRDRVLRGLMAPAMRALKTSAVAQDYLSGRGISVAQAIDLRLGYFDDNVYKRAVDRFGADLSDLGVGANFVGHIVALGRDLDGTAVGLHGRYAGDDVDVARRKMMSRGAQSKATPFMLYEARRVGTEVLLVEGLFDALVCHAHGEHRAVAIFGNKLTHQQSIALKEAGIAYAYLALDGDDAGRDGTVRTIKELTRRGIDAFVLPALEVEEGAP